MGHYSSDYEHADEQRRKAEKKQAKQTRTRVQSLIEELPGDTPARFVDALEDLRNWLYYQEKV